MKNKSGEICYVMYNFYVYDFKLIWLLIFVLKYRVR